MEQEHQFIDYIEQSIIKNWDKDSLTDYKGITLQYKDGLSLFWLLSLTEP